MALAKSDGLGLLDEQVPASPHPSGSGNVLRPLDIRRPLGVGAERNTHTIADLAARLLVVTCALNLNDVGSMLFDVGQVFSIVMLGSSIVLIAKQVRFG